MFITTDPAVNKYGEIYATVLGDNAVTFKAQMSKDAYITLMEYPGVTHYNTYEVVIGLDNSVTEVYDTPGGTRLVSANTPGILSGSSLRDFWIRWEDKVLEVGTGNTPGNNRVLFWQMNTPYYDVRTAAFSTMGSQHGTWELKRTTGEL